jgi:hypothetical protein
VGAKYMFLLRLSAGIFNAFYQVARIKNGVKNIFFSHFISNNSSGFQLKREMKIRERQ